MADILSLISRAELLEFSQNFPIARNYIGDTLMPDMKTRNIMAEYLVQAAGTTLPVMATVHALDTEAEIGSRPTLDKVEVKKFLIKRKINQTEALQMYADYGSASDDETVRYTLNDMARMSEAVKTRTEVAKMEVLYSGKMTIKENNVIDEVDYHVPAENMAFTFNWTTADADVLGDIQEVVDAASDAGFSVTGILTSGKINRYISTNKGVQTAIFGTAGVGVLPDRTRMQALFDQQFGFSNIMVNNEKYGIQRAGGAIESKRYYKDDKITFLVQAPAGTVGVGLWGVTPEEAEYGQYNEKSQNQFITVTQWATPDPVAVWTKASGMFIPVLPNPKALFVATVTLANP